MPQDDWHDDASPQQDLDMSRSPKSPAGEVHDLSGQQQQHGTPSSSEASPKQPEDRPDGVESDDNFEVSDDADEQQVAPPPDVSHGWACKHDMFGCE